MEWQIIQVMKQAAGIRFSFKEIGRIVDRREFRENPHWARPLLEKLTCERIIWKEEAFYLYPTDEQRDEYRKTQGKVRSTAVRTHSLPEAK